MPWEAPLSRVVVTLSPQHPASNYTGQVGRRDGNRDHEERHHLDVCYQRMTEREGAFPQQRQRTKGCGFEDLERVGQASKDLRFT